LTAASSPIDQGQLALALGQDLECGVGRELRQVVVAQDGVDLVLQGSGEPFGVVDMLKHVVVRRVAALKCIGNQFHVVCSVFDA
jgi:hypothetical protein